MAESVDNNQLEGLFSRLDVHLKGSQHKKALRLVEEILKINVGDEDAIKCKVAILIELGRFDDAIQTINQHDSAQQLAFEKAYCLYRLGSFPEALAVVQGGGITKPVARAQLEAQLHYRMGRNSDAIRVYHQLFKEHKVTSLELRTNVLAAYVAGGRAHEVPAVMEAMAIRAGDSFEVAFNTACGALAAGDLATARSQLEHAQRLGRETLLDEELDEGQVEEELAPLTVQLAFAAARLGDSAEAISACEGVLKGSGGDEAVMAVATNNWIAERLLMDGGDPAPKKLCADLLRKLEAFFDKVKESLDRRLSAAQKEALYGNYALLLLAAGRADAAQDVTASLLAKLPEAEAVWLVRAAVLAREGKAEAAGQLLAGGAGPSCALMRAQLAAAAGDAQQATEALQQAGGNDADLAQRPAMVATRIALLEAVGDATGALALAQGALSAAQGTPPAAGRGGKAAAGNDRKAAEAFLYQSLAKLQLKVGDVTAASRSYERAAGLAGRDAPGVFRLMGELARHSAAANLGAAGGGVVADLRASLPPLEQLAPHRVDELEDAAAGSSAARRRAAEEASKKAAARAAGGDAGGDAAAGAGAAAAAAARKKRKRRVRLPKGFDTAAPGPLPDPERWLPKWQRSDFKKKRSRRKDKEAVKGSQGAGRVDEALDRSNTVTEERADSPVPDRGPRGAANRKKKGRR